VESKRWFKQFKVGRLSGSVDIYVHCYARGDKRYVFMPRLSWDTKPPKFEPVMVEDDWSPQPPVAQAEWDEDWDYPEWYEDRPWEPAMDTAPDAGEYWEDHPMLIKQADPELERLLAEEEEIERRTQSRRLAGPPSPFGESGIGQSGTDVSDW
jgi:hypothetical protein